jgi:hypothetical protein
VNTPRRLVEALGLTLDEAYERRLLIEESDRTGGTGMTQMAIAYPEADRDFSVAGELKFHNDNVAIFKGSTCRYILPSYLPTSVDVYKDVKKYGFDKYDYDKIVVKYTILVVLNDGEGEDK